MPPLPAEKKAKWNAAFPLMVEDAVQFLFDRGITSLNDVTTDEFAAIGVRSLDEARKRALPDVLDVPKGWGWGQKTWIKAVRCSFTSRRAREDAAAVLRTLGEANELESAAPMRAHSPYNDTETPDHPGYEVFEAVFSDSECDRLKGYGKYCTEWVDLFNSVEWKPKVSHVKRMRVMTNDQRYEDMVETVMPTYKEKQNWSSVVKYSAFRQQGRVGQAMTEAKVIAKITPLLPPNAIFPSRGDVLHMIRANEKAPMTESRCSQPLHYDFPPGVAYKQHLSVMISLTDHCFLVVADRWGEDRTKAWKTVHVPKGAVIVFSSSLPHAGMGSVGVDGCERIHVYVAFNVKRKDVHPKDVHGEQTTFFAALEPEPRLKRPCP